MRLHNRQIKATFWNDPDLLQWPRDKRWFYEGLVQLADDSGCLEDNPFAFKVNLFPSPVDMDITEELLATWRDELIEAGKLVRYEVSGKQYLFMMNFHKHQTIDKPTPPGKASVPLPPWVEWVQDDSRRKSRYVVREEYLPCPGQVPDKSRTSPGITGTGTGTVTVTTITPQPPADDNPVHRNKQPNDNVNGGRRELIEAFANEYGRLLSQSEIEQIAEWEREFPHEMVLHALKTAVFAQNRAPRYIDGILRRWKAAGARSIQDVEELDRQFKARKDTANARGQPKSRKEEVPIFVPPHVLDNLATGGG